MRHAPWPMFLTGLVLVTSAVGCQMFGGGNSGTANSSSRSFGLEHVPRQSEPPLESTAIDHGRGVQTADAQAASAKGPAIGKPANRTDALTAFMADRAPGMVPPQPFPVSARTPSASESAGSGTE